MSEELILVDSEDREIGNLDKERCHDGEGHRHRAFSILLFDPEQRVLLQQRSTAKRLWPLYWSNSVCSHPRRGETLAVATQRRVREELGIDASLEFLYRFEYHARDGERGCEHEVCSVFIGRVDGERAARVVIDPAEIAAWEWVPRAEVGRRIEESPQSFTPWFRMEWAVIEDSYADRVFGPDRAG
ncbi:MAG: isopentenyl-diphosphate Delta-isomerase [Planctomycetes bacterium]|nr:isopentenyl-diphosphate Delta-isomerase [Planctomycetota bacterium]